jgi:1-acyl-sn-glycerol-3-phosphate acyltransferase
MLKKGSFAEAHAYRSVLARRLLRRGGYKLEVINKEYIPAGQTCIICSNHASYLDIPVMCAALNMYFGFIGKAELNDLPGGRLFFSTIDIPVLRKDTIKSAITFKRAIHALRQGRSLVIFPEGGIFRKPETVKSLKAGAFQLAIKLKLPILVAGLPDNYKLMNEDTHTAKTGKIRVILHELIRPEGTTAEELAQKVNSMLKNDINKYRDDEN